MFTPIFNLPQASNHIFERPHPFLTSTTHFQVVSPIFNLFKYFHQVFGCVTTYCQPPLNGWTSSWLPTLIPKPHHPFLSSTTHFQLISPFLTIFIHFCLFLIDFTHSQSLLFIFQLFLVNFDCSCLNLSVTAYFLINFICFLTIFDQFKLSLFNLKCYCKSTWYNIIYTFVNNSWVRE